MDPYPAIGSAGLFLLLVAYALTLTKKISNESTEYHALNLAGCIMLVIYALKIDSLVFAVLEGIWGLIALGFVLKKLQTQKKD